MKWVPRGWPWTEPQREVQANETDLRLGLTSRQRILAEQGSNFADVLEELAQERETATRADRNAKRTPGGQLQGPLVTSAAGGCRVRC